MYRKVLSFIALVSFISIFVMGCTGPNQAARGVGQPIGGALSVTQSVSQGAAEGYSGGDRDENPYGR